MTETALTRLDAVILAVDIGTSAARAVAFDAASAARLGEERVPYETYLPQPMWAEQDADDWLDCSLAAVRQLIGRLEIADRVVALAVTGQCPTVVPVDRRGRPMRRALLYRDNRAVAEADVFLDRIGGDEMHAVTGHYPAAFNIGPKILWLARHEPEVFRGASLFLQPRDYIVRAFTGELCTDGSHAPATILFDLGTRTWSETILETVGLDPSMLPPVFPSTSAIGTVRPQVARSLGISPGTVVAVGAADSQACAFGMGVVDAGPMSEMAGSSTCLNAVTPAVLAHNGIAHYVHVTDTCLTTETGLNASGSAFAWIVRTIYAGDAPPRPGDYSRAEADAAAADAALDGVVAVPRIADGDRDAANARGVFTGLSQRHGRGALVRATLEGVAFGIRSQVDDLADAGIAVTELRVSGGAARVALWNRIKSDVLRLPVVAVPEDAAARGTAMLAALAAGLVPDTEAAVSHWVKLAPPVLPTAADGRLDAAYTRFRSLQRSTAL